MAGQVGFCGLDRRRMPLAGTEHRGCWEARTAGLPVGLPVRPADSGHEGPGPRWSDDRIARTFVPVELLADHPIPLSTAEPPIGSSKPAMRTVLADEARDDAVRPEPWQDRRTLFGESDR